MHTSVPTRRQFEDLAVSGINDVQSVHEVLMPDWYFPKHPSPQKSSPFHMQN